MSAEKELAKATASKTPSGKPSLVGIDEVLDGLKTIAECLRDLEKERTAQTKAREEARVDVERIHAMRDVLLAYLDKSFDERRENFGQLFARLDGAIETGNVQLAAVVLDSVVKLADSSPFKALNDIASARKALGEKGKQREF